VAAPSIEPRPAGSILDWLVLAGDQAFIVVSHKNGSALLRPSDATHLATVRMDEIKAHAARAATGVIKALE
jgi:hypothetical protein